MVAGSTTACRLRLVYRSGRMRTVHEGAARALPRRDAVRPGPERCRWRLQRDRRARLSLERSARPASMTLRNAIRPADAERDRPGRRQPRPDPRPRGDAVRRAGRAVTVELVYHVTDGPARRRRRGLRSPTRRRSSASRTGWSPCPQGRRDGAAVGGARCDAAGRESCCFGADVLPAGPGWLAPWLCRLEQARADARRHAARSRRGVVARRGNGRDDGALRATSACRRPTCRARRPPPPGVSADCVGLTRTVADLLPRLAHSIPEPGRHAGARSIARCAARAGARDAPSQPVRPLRRVTVRGRGFAAAVDSAALGLVLKRFVQLCRRRRVGHERNPNPSGRARPSRLDAGRHRDPGARPRPGARRARRGVGRGSWPPRPRCSSRVARRARSAPTATISSCRPAPTTASR